jgi:hypothetical protein
MGSFLEKGDAIYWEKQKRGLFNLFDKVDKYFKYTHPDLLKDDIQAKSLLKGVRHFRNVFREE